MLLHKVVISGGGTGGHIFPAVAIGNEIKKRYPNADILFIGALGRMEMEKVPAAGFEIIGLPIVGLQRRLTLANFLVPFKLIKSIFQAKKIIKNFKPQVVIGVGGYASAAMLYAAASANIPCLIQEQNSYAGITNKWLSKKVKTICVAYDGMEKFFPKEKIILTGNPVRAEIANNNNLNQKEAKVALEFDENKPLILAVGGSLGARTINNSLQKGLQKIVDNNCQLLWQTGKNFEANTQNLMGVKAQVFINEMSIAYAAADIVISRAGASSISELTIVCKPLILVPSPNVSEDHQTQNAMALVTKNAAILVTDQQAGLELVEKAIALAQNEDLKIELKENIKELAKPNALIDIVNQIEALII
ncbi:MAG: undecaprenyldiphospho-muramoylpentapeptide beta-N-acetylglucosaminyltransferase [Bacteroidetes bacterium]|nr:undecaprenyldiphospho-muramoylpentapeptide beta-N-acetylglucosaminyltransferase [Bacteroidota bacterium]